MRKTTAILSILSIFIGSAISRICDSDGAISGCANNCNAGSESVPDNGICNGRKCCRTNCAGAGTFCNPVGKGCDSGRGFQEVDGSCPNDEDFVCCAPRGGSIADAPPQPYPAPYPGPYETTPPPPQPPVQYTTTLPPPPAPAPDTTPAPPPAAPETTPAASAPAPAPKPAPAPSQEPPKQPPTVPPQGQDQPDNTNPQEPPGKGKSKKYNKTKKNKRRGKKNLKKKELKKKNIKKKSVKKTKLGKEKKKRS